MKAYKMFDVKRPALFVFVAYYVHSVKEAGVCRPDQKDKCCVDYYQRGDKCISCNGSVGFQCSAPCPKGFCGDRCKTKCSCGNGDCNSYTCICSKAFNDSGLEESSQSDHLLFIVGLGFPVLSISVVISVLWILKRKQTEKENPHEAETGSPVDNLAIDPSEEYAVIRESQVIDNDDNHDDDDDGDDDTKMTHKAYTFQILYAEGPPESMQNFYNVLSHK